MKLLLRTFPDSAGYDDRYVAELECAVVDLTPQRLVEIERRFKIARWCAEHDECFAEATFHDCTPDFYAYSLVEACEQEVERFYKARGLEFTSQFDDAFYDDGVTWLPDGIDLADFEIQPTEGERIELWMARHHPANSPDHEFSWHVRPKHSDIAVHTAGLTLSHPLILETRKAPQ